MNPRKAERWHIPGRSCASRASDRMLARLLARRPVAIPVDFVPTVSFTFDDFPQSAIDVALPILRAAGMTATWYAASDLLGGPSPCGPVASVKHIAALAAAGHEIGDHTCRHLDASAVPAARYEADMEDNRRLLAIEVPGVAIRSFAYPFGSVTLGAKRAAMARSETCRGTMKGLARGTVDFGLLPANALYESQSPLSAVRDLIGQLGRGGGWAILYTHDVAPDPSPWGCRPDTFAAVVEAVGRAGLRVAPVGTVSGELIGRPA